LATLYGDGGNLHEYLGSNSWGRYDAMGLSWDPFAWHVDGYLAEDAGSKSAFLGRIAGAGHTTAYMAAYLTSWVGGPVAGWIGDAAMAAMGEPDTLRHSDWWQNLRLGEQVLSDFLGLVAHTAYTAVETNLQYVQQFGVGPNAPTYLQTA